jgi:hypothetical protein
MDSGADVHVQASQRQGIVTVMTAVWHAPGMRVGIVVHGALPRSSFAAALEACARTWDTSDNLSS